MVGICSRYSSPKQQSAGAWSMQPPAAHQSVKAIAGWELATHEDTDDTVKLTTRLFWTGVPATNSYRSGEPVKMKLWLRISGKLGHSTRWQPCAEE